jgi:hypothetical protein
MSEADDGSTPKFGRPDRVIDCAARLEALYQIIDEKADDEDKDEALVDAWCDAEWDAIDALIAAAPRSPAELAVKAEWLRRLIVEHRYDSALPEPFCRLMAALSRDARALAAGAR